MRRDDDTNDLQRPRNDDGHEDRLPRNRSLLPRGPKRVEIQRAGIGIRILIYDWSQVSIDTAGSSTTEFLVFWTEDVDMTSESGVQAGFKRAVLLSPSIPNAGNETRPDQPLIGFYADPKYLTGYFYIRGRAASGALSAVTPPIRVTSGTGGTIPRDVEHFVASESGEQHGQTVLSVVSYAFRIPFEGGDIDHVQFMYRNYPVLNEFAEGESRRVTTGKGGTQTGQLKFPIGRRIGSGTISIVGTAVTGSGTDFLSVAAAAGGDQLEVFGVRARIASVASNTSMTLTSAWTGPDVTAVGDWQTIAAVTIYAVAEAFNGARLDDITAAPHVTLDLDGDLSAPVAPTLTATAIGNAVRLVVEPPVGTQLARALVYRKEGSGLTFDKATWQMIHPFAIDNANPSPDFQWDDTNFTAYQRENDTVFSYAATLINVRDQEGAASTVVEATVRTDDGSDGTDGFGKIGLRQLLFNAGLRGTSGGTVAANDAGQYEFSTRISAGVHEPGRPYGTSVGHGGQANGVGDFRGYTTWESSDGGTGAAGAAPVFINGNEIQYDPPGNGKAWYVYQELTAWDTGLGAAFRKIRNDCYCCIQFKLARKVGAAQPNGTIGLYVEFYSDNAFLAVVPRRQRNSATDAFDYLTGSSAYLEISGASLLTTWTRYVAVLKLDSNATASLVKQLRFNVVWFNGTQGNVRFSEPGMNDGEEVGVWTQDMGDPTMNYPGFISNPPGEIGDGRGRRDIVLLP